MNIDLPDPEHVLEESAPSKYGRTHLLPCVNILCVGQVHDSFPGSEHLQSLQVLFGYVMILPLCGTIDVYLAYVTEYALPQRELVTN